MNYTLEDWYEVEVDESSHLDDKILELQKEIEKLKEDKIKNREMIANNRFNDIIKNIIELKKLGYTIGCIVNGDLPNVGHELGMSLKEIYLTKI